MWGANANACNRIWKCFHLLRWRLRLPFQFRLYFLAFAFSWVFPCILLEAYTRSTHVPYYQIIVRIQAIGTESISIGHATTKYYSWPETTVKIDAENTCLCLIMPVRIMSEIAKKKKKKIKPLGLNKKSEKKHLL